MELNVSPMVVFHTSTPMNPASHPPTICTMTPWRLSQCGQHHHHHHGKREAQQEVLVVVDREPTPFLKRDG